MSRSVVIDNLLRRDPDSGTRTVYIYFDYKDERNQTTDRIIASLLKQLISPFHDLPAGLKSIFDGCVKGSPRPELPVLVKLFTTYSQQFTAVMLIVDAFDECHQQEGLLEYILKPLYLSGIHIYVTSRPHLLGNLIDTFGESVVIKTIEAEGIDVENYLTRRLEGKHRLTADFKREAIKEIGARARGM